MLFSTAAAPINIPINSVQGVSFFPQPLPTFVTCGLFDDSHFNRCEMIICGFNLHFSGD